MVGTEKHRYAIVMHGDAVEATIAKLDEAVADYWLAQPAQKLFDHTHRSEDDELENSIPQEFQLSEWRDFPGQFHVDGVELAKGEIVVSDQDDNVVYERGLDSPSFADDHIDRKVEYTEENGFGGNVPCHVGLTFYTGSVTYDLVTDTPFRPELLRLRVCQTSETTPFVCGVVYDGDELSGDGNGHYRMQSSGIYAEGQEPNVSFVEPTF